LAFIGNVQSPHAEKGVLEMLRILALALALSITGCTVHIVQAEIDGRKFPITYYKYAFFGLASGMAWRLVEKDGEYYWVYIKTPRYDDVARK
jgi:hypothetical protein